MISNMSPVEGEWKCWVVKQPKGGSTIEENGTQAWMMDDCI